MRMSLQASLWNTITDIAIAGPAQVKRYREMSPPQKKISSNDPVGVLQIPDDQGLVTRGGQEHIGILEGGRKGLVPDQFSSRDPHPR